MSLQFPTTPTIASSSIEICTAPSDSLFPVLPHKEPSELSFHLSDKYELWSPETVKTVLRLRMESSVRKRQQEMLSESSLRSFRPAMAKSLMIVYDIWRSRMLVSCAKRRAPVVSMKVLFISSEVKFVNSVLKFD